MKYCLTILFLFIITLFLARRQPVITSPPPPQPPATPFSPAVLVDFKGRKYRLYLQPVAQTANLRLIINFSEKKSAAAIFSENHCIYGINGGFYTKDRKPLGLFYANGHLLSSKINANALFNGYAYGNSTNLLSLTDKTPLFPENAPGFYFQAGPLFTPETGLTIRDDEGARRILIGKTRTAQFYFLAVTESGNTGGGPHLADLPLIMQRFNDETMKQFVLFLNLDGGSSSAFFGVDGTRLEELMPIGSFICASASSSASGS